MRHDWIGSPTWLQALFLNGCIVSFWSAGHDVRQFNREKHVQHTVEWLFAFVDLFFVFVIK